MSKNLEWLKEKLEGIIDNFESFPDKTDWNHGYIMALHDYRDLIDQVEQPEITEGEALDKIVESYPLTPNDIPWILDRYVAGVIVEQPERPVIPDYVAEWINRNRTLGTSISYLMNYDKIKAHNRQLHLWCYEGENDDNLHKLARAWLDGYTVEEKKYIVPLGELYTLCKLANGVVDIYKEDKDKLYLDDDFIFTEQEIKDYDERYFAFAEEVKE